MGTVRTLGASFLAFLWTMGMGKNSFRAIAFDYGNTLVEFGQAQVARCDMALAETVGRLYGPPDVERLCAIRKRNRMAPYEGDPPEYRENDLIEITANLVRELYSREPTPQEIEEMIEARVHAFVSAIECSAAVRQMLGRLKRAYRLALVSNYPSARSIRASMDKAGLTEHFDVVVISGDLGVCKPHPLMFEATIRQLDMSREEILFVGDNWLADIQGAKRAGMTAVLTTQWERAEKFDPQPGDFQPDLAIAQVTDLEQFL